MVPAVKTRPREVKRSLPAEASRTTREASVELS
jgi:hypothetical protein